MADIAYRPYTTQTPSGVPGGYQRVNADPDMFGAAEGRAVAGLGESLQRGALAVGGALVRHQAQVAENLATDANLQFMEKATALYGDYSQKLGKDGYQAFPEFKKSLSDLWNESVGGLESEEAKRLFTQGTRRFYVAQLADGQGHAQKQFQAWGEDASQGRADALANQASLALNNPNQMDAFLNAGADEIRKNRQMRGFPPEAIDNDIREYRGKTLESIISLKSKDDPQAAMAMLQQYGPSMDPGSRARIAATLRPIARDQEADALVNTALGVPNQTGQRGSQSGGPQGFANNIGNLRVSGADWIGKGSPYNGFETFSTVEQGAAAAVKNIQHIADVHGGSVSIADLITTWAPASDNNDPTAYAATVAKAVGMDVDSDVPLDDPKKMTALVKAMAKVEKGADYSESQIAAGVNAALDGSPLPNAGQQVASVNPNGQMPDKSSAVQAIVEATNGDPDLMAAALAKLNQRYSLHDAMTATAREQLQTQLPDVMRAAQMGNQDVALPIDLMRQSGMSEDDFNRTVTEFDTSKRIGMMTQGLAFAPEADLKAALADAQNLTGPVGDAINAAAGGPAGTGDQSMRLSLQSGAIAQIKKLQQDRDQFLRGDNADPASYVANAPAVVQARDQLAKAAHMASVTNDDGLNAAATRDYVATVLGQQAAMGVPVEKRRILGKEQAQRLGTALSPQPGQSGEMAVAAIRQGSKIWGDAWGQIVSELGPNLSDVGRAVAIMPVSQNHAAALLVEAAAAKSDVEKATQPFSTEIRQAVGQKFADFLSTFRAAGVGGVQEGGRLMSAGELLARRHVMDGQTPEEAATSAYNELVGSQYDVLHNIRVPLPLDSDRITRAAEGEARRLTVNDVDPVIDDLGAGTTSQEQYLASIRVTHNWTNDPSGKGLVLLDGMGRPVLSKGKPIYRSWQQLMQAEPLPQSGFQPMSQGSRDPATLPSAGITTLMSLTPQEQFLYQWHVNNVTGRNGGKSFKQPNGATSTVLQMVEPAEVFGLNDGLWRNIPSVWDGKPHSEDEAIEHAKKIGVSKWPAYKTEKEAQDRYDKMHEFMEKDVE